MARLSPDRLSPTHGWPCCVVTTRPELGGDPASDGLTVIRGYDVRAHPSLHAAGVAMQVAGFTPVGELYRGEPLAWAGLDGVSARVSFAPPDFIRRCLEEAGDE